ncbi:hypothetical protein OPT61_g9208 [Boeremia exigua]|uniref:Uncharacterized protein n=1 Tax=Boeremia exigua TaxID=749465 RepID=A0ACC2HV22_9PLEO|nr:hypothetical protein OPT61_g9208 [Boeremia exigua]
MSNGRVSVRSKKHALARCACGVVYNPLRRKPGATLAASNPGATSHNTARMAPRNALANISFTVDSASEDDMTHDELGAMPTPDSNTENKAPARKARGRAAQPAKAAATTKATSKNNPTSRAAEAKKDNTAAKKAPAKAGRKALAERKNGADSDAEGADELEEDDVLEPAEAARARKARTQAGGKGGSSEEGDKVQGHR